MRVVVDTNVLVSGVINPHGTPGRVVDSIVSQAFAVLFDDRILSEYRDVLLRPMFAANHRWAMELGEQSLKLELARRRATSDAARSTIPPPPGPVTYAGAALVGGAVAVGASLAYLMLRARRKNH
jgi:predicted nucleic acid-binding protein